MNDNRFYVYALLDPRKPGKYQYNNICFLYEPFYIGKGQFNRCNNHIRDAVRTTKNSHKLNKIRKIVKQSLIPIICKIATQLTNSKSINLEKKYIKEVGRLDLKTGCLANLTDGGEGVLNMSLELREAKSKKWTGINNPMNWIDFKGENNPFYGKKHSKKTKKQIALSREGVVMSEETVKKISIKNTGLKRTEETKARMRKPKTKSHKEKISLYRKSNQFGTKNPSIKWKYRAISPIEIEYKNIYSLSLFCKEHGLNDGTIRNKLRNNRHKYKGWLFYRTLI